MQRGLCLAGTCTTVQRSCLGLEDPRWAGTSATAATQLATAREGSRAYSRLSSGKNPPLRSQELSSERQAQSISSSADTQAWLLQSRVRGPEDMLLSRVLLRVPLCGSMVELMLSRSLWLFWGSVAPRHQVGNRDTTIQQLADRPGWQRVRKATYPENCCVL